MPHAHVPTAPARSSSRPARLRSLAGGWGLCVLAASVGGIATAAPAAAALPVFVVTSTGDAPDATHDGRCATSTGLCTLRAALQEAATASGHVTVKFKLRGNLPATIAPASKLPPLTNPAGVTIDGFSQDGALRNAAGLADTGTIMVQLAGPGPASFEGLNIVGPDNIVRGLAVYNFSKVILLSGERAVRNRVVGNHLCTNAAGTFGAATLNTNGLGVYLAKGASDNVIGAPGAENRNVISGCAHRGVIMSFAPTTGNKVQNNIIGLTPSGKAALPNRSHGVDINYTYGNTIGGDAADERNVISGNDGSGTEISHSRNTHDNKFVGNFVGTDLTGSAAPAYAANKSWGVRLEGPFSCVTCSDEEWAVPKEGVPHDNVVRDNVLVGNLKGGLLIDKGQHKNVVTGNRIGVTTSGVAAGNGRYGVRIEHGAHDNLLRDNEIAYNPAGITVAPTGGSPDAAATATDDNRFTRNRIHDNTGLGIDLAPLAKVNGASGDPLVNRGIDAPVLLRGTATSVSGTTCASCVVEVFTADIDAVGTGEGKTFLAVGTASSAGDFRITLPASRSGSAVTATASRTDGSTSEFARTLRLPAP